MRGWYSVIGLTTSPALVTIPILYARPLSAFGWRLVRTTRRTVQVSPQPGLMMTDLANESPEVRAADADSTRRMDRLRAALVADMRHTTAADAKGNRKMVIGALSVLAPTSLLRATLARCGKRNPANDSREFCRRPCCGVCMQRQARWLFRERLWPALENVPTTQMRWVTILTHRCANLDHGVHEMQRQHRRLQHILSKFAGGTGKSRTHRGLGCAGG